MTTLPLTGAARGAGSAPSIVDVLIAERAPRLTGGPAWPLLRPLLHALLSYGKARRMAAAIAPLPGAAALQHVSGLLDLQVAVRGLEHLPATGRCVVVCNHPSGIGDGVAVFDALKRRRPDLIFYANSDAHRVCPGFYDVLIPVEWVETKRTRDRTRLTLQRTREAMEAERCLVVFPAGRLARMEHGALTDPPWEPTALSVARRYGAPVVPVHVTGPASTLFHLFDRLSQELRDITLFHELLNKRRRRFAVTIGPAIPAGQVDATDTDAVKTYVERVLPAAPDHPFTPAPEC